MQLTNRHWFSYPGYSEITTDHGRGKTATDWRDHGKDVDGAGDTWMAFVSPSMTQRGGWRDHAAITAAQAAATLIEWMGFNPAEFAGAAPPVPGS